VHVTVSYVRELQPTSNITMPFKLNVKQRVALLLLLVHCVAVVFCAGAKATYVATQHGHGAAHPVPEQDVSGNRI